MAEFMWEIGTEEIPARMLPGAITAMGELTRTALQEAGLGFAQVESQGTPRRLLVVVHGLHDKQADVQEERRGPALQAAFDSDGNPTKAAQGFARGCGVDVDQLSRVETPKGTYLSYTLKQAGKGASEVLPGIMQQVFKALPWPKTMRWSDGESRFVRPVQSVTALLNGQQVAVELAENVRYTDAVSGHRFMGKGAVVVQDYASYQQAMADGKVMLKSEDRMATIRAGVLAQAASVGGVVASDEGLVAENASLTEWPVALLGRFDERYLEIPPEVLTTSMRYHQKYFPVLDAQGGLKPHFVVIANMETEDQTVLVRGYQRVLKARLEDAAFFWAEDRKIRLTDRLPDLQAVVWQAKLGSLFQKSQRMAHLASAIAARVAPQQAALAEKAGLYSKCDLVTGMVGEFPELQGIMGGYYLPRERAQDEVVALAIREHYMPAGAGDALPQSLCGRIVSLADKLDTLVGCFGMGITPTGTKDPFGLRRAALGVIRLLLQEQGLRLPLRQLCEEAYRQYGEIGLEMGEAQTVQGVLAFFYGRLQAHLKAEGVDYDLIDAVQGLNLDDLWDAVSRVKALVAFKQDAAYEALVAANKRMANILSKVEDSALDLTLGVDEAVLKASAEQGLAAAVAAVEDRVKTHSSNGRYAEALGELAALRGVIDTFFDEVMVMDEDDAVRHNRLRLLATVLGLFRQVADVSCLVVAEK
ncbi:glycyl-tRNA synthetase beta chain [Magnetococcus marinus MC-1]|uniref:Glycine--tRNA ligase beta subunit n=1 Tax=Magnetococcus marinus (strain ATCC BAA-1437 / JCM 17883 / MC-1) TaxID=156889 RepID=SYGB_MAGMM|nr:glycine--tRNA ligase subunit beta [Magnetococcus marinus]A0L7K9.1 RecName: Full=Glycine--tRNA ligase beta subunit; AltName: Full=Glycyl-tRNA synthetase beta subunit; Short=GlyRS [Magnetococcus marinus MC-1]ABK43952.1 glycyl-tRNA synthetase beta chain [Magnetococcus marinus MC-1]